MKSNIKNKKTYVRYLSKLMCPKTADKRKFKLIVQVYVMDCSNRRQNESTNVTIFF